MDNSIIKFKVNSGYQVIRKSRKVDLQTAYEMLESKKQKEYAEAVMSEDHAELVWYVARCPYCGKETLLSKSTKTENIYLCKKCGQFSKWSEEKAEITITHDENSINVLSIIKDIKSLLDVKWNDKITFSNAFPLYEKVSFDFEKGEALIFLVDNVGNIISSETVKRKMVEEEKSPLIYLLIKNHTVRRKVGNEFRKHSKDLQGISLDECVFENFVAFTRYRGFDQKFYDAIPFECDSYRVDESFGDVSSLFNNPEGAMRMLKNSTLPYVKSVKRIFAENQGLFFYIKECEKFHDILKDVNLLCEVLSGINIYNMLSTFHANDGYFYFARDLCKEKGGVFVGDLLTDITFGFYWCAGDYCAMSEYRRKKYISEFKRKENIYDYSTKQRFGEFFSPVPQMPEYIKDCVIGEYFFKSLKSKSEYTLSGKKLNNCLEEYIKYKHNPVTIVIFQGEPVAAIEVEIDTVVQMKKRNNEPIEVYSPLFDAIRKWCKKYNLKRDCRE